MTKRFTYRFEDEGPSTLSYQVGADARMECTVENGVNVIYINRRAAHVLATVFAKLALGSHTHGFHLHLERDLDPEKPEALRISLLD